VSALGEREGVVLRSESGEHPAEGEPRIGVPVEEDDGFSVWVPLVSVVERHTRGEAHRGQLQFVRPVHR
jgi:hypothetical protein